MGHHLVVGYNRPLSWVWIGYTDVIVIIVYIGAGRDIKHGNWHCLLTSYILPSKLGTIWLPESIIGSITPSSVMIRSPTFSPASKCRSSSKNYTPCHTRPFLSIGKQFMLIWPLLRMSFEAMSSDMFRYGLFFFFFFFTLFNSLSLDTNYRHVGMLQHHQTPEMKARAQSLGENTLDYDACAQIWVRTWDDWMKFYTSEEYAASLNEDCDRFMALPMTYMVGQENLVVGDASRWIGGNDGLRLHAPKLSKSYS